MKPEIDSLSFDKNAQGYSTIVTRRAYGYL